MREPFGASQNEAIDGLYEDIEATGQALAKPPTKTVRNGCTELRFGKALMESITGELNTRLGWEQEGTLRREAVDGLIDPEGLMDVGFILRRAAHALLLVTATITARQDLGSDYRFDRVGIVPDAPESLLLHVTHGEYTVSRQRQALEVREETISNRLDGTLDGYVQSVFYRQGRFGVMPLLRQLAQQHDSGARPA